MLTRLFSNISLQSGLASAIMVAVLAIFGFYNSDIQEFNLGFGLFKFLLSPTIVKLLLVLITMFSALAFNSVMNSLGILPGAYQVAILFGLQLLILTLGAIEIEVMLAIPFIVLAIHKVFKVGIVPDPRSELFDIGLIAGFISLFLIEGIALIFFCWVSCIVFRCLNIKTVLIPIVGLFALYTILFTISFFISDSDFGSFIVNRYRTISLNVIQYDFRVILDLSGVILVTLLGIAEVVRTIGKAVVFKRQVMSLSIGVLIVIVVLSLIQSRAESIYFLAVFPIAILQYNLLLSLSKWWQKDLIYLTLLANFIYILI